MNLTLWILQVLLALHTLMGAIWKFSNSEQAAGLQSMPHGLWMGLIGLEVLCTAGLLLPAILKNQGILTPIAALGIAAEMLLFCGFLLASGDPNRSPMIYWLVVAAICGFVAYGRFALRPIAA